MINHKAWVTQFQRNEELPPTPEFSDGSGIISYEGSNVFYGSKTEENCEFDIHFTPGGAGCTPVELIASDRVPDYPARHPIPPTCPIDLSGNYESPHLIIPVDSSQANAALGSSYNGTITKTVNSIYNFDILEFTRGKTCSLVFLFPKQSQLETSSYTFSGRGGIDFRLLSSIATTLTTYNSSPLVKTDYGVVKVAPGTSNNIATFACPTDTTISFELSASENTTLTYFQKQGPSPIGLYITIC